MVSSALADAVRPAPAAVQPPAEAPAPDAPARPLARAWTDLDLMEVDALIATYELTRPGGRR